MKNTIFKYFLLMIGTTATAFASEEFMNPRNKELKTEMLKEFPNSYAAFTKYRKTGRLESSFVKGTFFGSWWGSYKKDLSLFEIVFSEVDLDKMRGLQEANFNENGTPKDGLTEENCKDAIFEACKGGSYSFRFMIWMNGIKTKREKGELEAAERELEKVKKELEKVKNKLEKVKKELEKGELEKVKNKLEKVKNKLETVKNKLETVKKELEKVKLEKANNDLEKVKNKLETANNDLKTANNDLKTAKKNPINAKLNDFLKKYSNYTVNMADSTIIGLLIVGIIVLTIIVEVIATKVYAKLNESGSQAEFDFLDEDDYDYDYNY